MLDNIPTHKIKEVEELIIRENTQYELYESSVTSINEITTQLVDSLHDILELI